MSKYFEIIDSVQISLFRLTMAAASRRKKSLSQFLFTTFMFVIVLTISDHRLIQKYTTPPKYYEGLTNTPLIIALPRSVKFVLKFESRIVS